jgi:Siphovirus Gp157
MRLYEIANEMQALLSELENNPDMPDFESRMESINLKAEDKIKNVGYMIKTLQAEGEIIEQEYKRLEKKKRSNQAHIDWLRTYLAREMERLQITKVPNAPYFNINLREGKYKLNAHTLNEALIPSEYKSVSQVIKLDKSRLVDEMLAGVIIPGAELVRDNYVEIR